MMHACINTTSSSFFVAWKII